MTTSQTALCGLMGNPVAHSLSPAMQGAAFAALGLDYAYLSFCVERRDIYSALAGLKVLGARGLNITVPYKGAVLPLLDDIDDSAGRIGAVNTIVFADGRLRGYNTDAPGFSRALAAAGFDPSGKKVVVLGAGGAAAAAAFAMIDKANNLVIVTRGDSLEKGRALALRLGARAKACDINDLDAVLQDARLLVNATSAGMAPHVNETPVPAGLLRPALTVFDVVYNPRETRLLREARAAGCRVISGLEMLIYQGALSFELWTGVTPPIDIMKQAALNALGEGISGKERIALIGFMGSGKSSAGKVLARMLGRRFMETDAMVEKAAGKSVSRIFAEEGEPSFRAREAAAVREALSIPGAVISCGGGVVLNSANIAYIKEQAAVIYLKALPQTLLARVGRSRRRPLLPKGGKLDAITVLLGARESLYEQAADITINTSNLSVEDVAGAIISVIKNGSIPYVAAAHSIAGTGGEGRAVT